MAQKPPTKQITNLNQIDIAKMDISDLQNIDYQKLLASVRKKPDIAISISCVIIAIFLSFNIFMRVESQGKTLTTKNAEMEAKLKILTEYKTAQSELQTFLGALPPKITENNFINIITDLAVKNNVQIDSFSPAQNRNDPVYDLTIINLSASAKNYLNVQLFIKDIENSNANIRINSWSGSKGIPQGGARRGQNQTNAEDLLINFRLDLALVTFKE